VRTRIFNTEVLYADEDPVRVNREDIETLTMQAEKNERKRMRLCAHHRLEDPLHEMLIIHTSETYVRPHKHLNKSESFHVVEGRVDVVMFDEMGTIIVVLPMGDYRSGLYYFYRIADPVIPTLIIRYDVLVIHEVTNGPFKPEETIHASWAPEDKDYTAKKAFMQNLGEALEIFLKNNLKKENS